MPDKIVAEQHIATYFEEREHADLMNLISEADLIVSAFLQIRPSNLVDERYPREQRRDRFFNFYVEQMERITTGDFGQEAKEYLETIEEEENHFVSQQETMRARRLLAVLVDEDQFKSLQDEVRDTLHIDPKTGARLDW